MNNDVKNFMSQQGIKWHFIVESAPWMGGFYERLVRNIKQCMRKSVGKLCLVTVSATECCN
jgi:hypothetical protein